MVTGITRHLEISNGLRKQKFPSKPKEPKHKVLSSPQEAKDTKKMGEQRENRDMYLGQEQRDSNRLEEEMARDGPAWGLKGRKTPIMGWECSEQRFHRTGRSKCWSS